jgi:hypothetical protein
MHVEFVLGRNLEALSLLNPAAHQSATAKATATATAVSSTNQLVLFTKLEPGSDLIPSSYF